MPEAMITMVTAIVVVWRCGGDVAVMWRNGGSGNCGGGSTNL